MFDILYCLAREASVANWRKKKNKFGTFYLVFLFLVKKCLTFGLFTDWPAKVGIFYLV